MARLLICFFILLNTAFSSHISAKTTPLVNKAIPTWCERQEVNRGNNEVTSGAEHGIAYLLVDNQTNTVTEETYSHVAYRIVDNVGIEGNSELSVNLTPLFRSLLSMPSMSSETAPK